LTTRSPKKKKREGGGRAYLGGRGLRAGIPDQVDSGEKREKKASAETLGKQANSSLLQKGGRKGKKPRKSSAGTKATGKH